MQRVTGANFLANGNGPGKNAWQNYNSSTGQAGTVPDAATLNSWQEELAGYIEAMGLALNPLDSTQLRQAISAHVATQMRGMFGPSPTLPASMVVGLAAGYLTTAGSVTAVTAQTTPAFVAPVGNPRIDRIVINRTTGILSVIGGTPAAIPVAPAVPATALPVAQVALATTSTAITAAMITDERDLPALGLGSAAFLPASSANAGAGICAMYVYGGNPNGHVAGTAAVVGVSAPDMVWDSADGLLYVCTTSGTAASASWSTVTSSTTSAYLGTSTGSVNAQLFTPSPAVSAYTTGSVVYVGVAGYTNTAAMTVSISGLGAVSVYKEGPTGPIALTGGEWVAGEIITMRYDGSHMQMAATDLGSAAMANASSGTGVVSAMNGAGVAGNIPSFYDAAGTIRDSGIAAASVVSQMAFQQDLCSAATAGGTSDAITAAFSPAITATTMASGVVELSVRAAYANATTTPTFAPNAVTAHTIVKGSNQALAPGDIAGAGHWITLQWDSTLTAWVLLNPATGVSQTTLGPVRQCVLAASGDSNVGTPWLTAGSGLAVNLAATSVNVRLAFAAGFGVAGAVDYVGSITADLSSAWSGLTGSATNFLYVARNASTGALTYGATTLAPIYQQGGTTSVTSGQYTFRTDQMVMYLGNGATASPVQTLFVGEAVTGASSVTSVVNYALLGSYDSGWIATLPGAAVYTSKAANLGTDSVSPSMLAKCTTVDATAYPIGTILVPAITTNISGNPIAPVQLSCTRNAVGVQAGPSGTGWASNVYNNGNTNASMTAASWSYRIIVKRGF